MEYLDVKCPLKAAGSAAADGVAMNCTTDCAWHDRGCAIVRAASAIADVGQGMLGLNEAGGYAPILHVRHIAKDGYLEHDDLREAWSVKKYEELPD